VNPYLLSGILGIVEGLTEFLPVSSTAHLRLTEAILGHITGQPNILEDGYWKMYSIVIQLGAILCLPIYFRHRIAKFLKTFPNGERGDRTALNHPLTLVVIAFVVTAIPAFLLTKIIGKNLESLKVMGTSLLVGGIVMWAVDHFFGWVAGADGSPASGHPVLATTPTMERIKPWQAVWVGAAQILSAVFPGTSRSMSTIAAGQVAGMSRPAALEFSFFLSMPTMIVATGYDFLKTVVLKKHAPGETLAPVHMDSQRWIILAIGFVVSFLVAWGVVAWFMNWVRSRGFAPFAIYRISVGIAVLVWAFKAVG
jgi:undecaprenyl-diphosphatase